GDISADAHQPECDDLAADSGNLGGSSFAPGFLPRQRSEDPSTIERKAGQQVEERQHEIQAGEPAQWSRDIGDIFCDPGDEAEDTGEREADGGAGRGNPELDPCRGGTSA